ncbi:MAG: ATP-binding protein [Sphaerochaeta sp.]|jgi:hypothetical protein|nr:ATP-binding protein [Sphaerochaeta sp.]PKL27821.1 MAG: ATP-binding protein [Spirochaetae bacterium HGW-Spirochaetae-2]
MSNVNIKRAIENIRESTSVYTPIIEIVINAIQAIEETRRVDGVIWIRVIRSKQEELDGSEQSITGFIIEDNGIGFTQTHRDSFDTLFSDLKAESGGKGFGRFICLKYFSHLHIGSYFEESGKIKYRSFSMGMDQDIIVNEKVVSIEEDKPLSTTIKLLDLKKGNYEKRLSTFSWNIIERILPYFITDDYQCPQIFLAEEDRSNAICLNRYLENFDTPERIQEISSQNTIITVKGGGQSFDFQIRLFKFYSPKNQKSRVSLVANKREVTVTPLHKYIPEFEEEFFEISEDDIGRHERNYIVKAYVLGNYLDENVSLERGGFEFNQMYASLSHPVSQSDIESEAAEMAKGIMGDEICTRQEKKRNLVRTYVDLKAPWHKDLVSNVNLTNLPCNPSDQEIEIKLQTEKFSRELEIKKDVANVLNKATLDGVQEKVLEIISKVSGNSKNDLIHYVALRKIVLELLQKSLERDDEGKYSSEGLVHDIIFPRRGDTETTSFADHNLWLLDERLNFSWFVSSDKTLNGELSDRPDLLIYNNRVAFRGENESSNPITIFEFKRPFRDDFANPSSKDDPVQQIVRYVNAIRDGKCQTPEGRKINVNSNTPFYGYVICDLTTKVEKWLEREKDFKPMPDRLGWFHWMDNINLYLEVISWEKVVKDADMRNRIFFNKLGLA